MKTKLTTFLVLMAMNVGLSSLYSHNVPFPNLSQAEIDDLCSRVTKGALILCQKALNNRRAKHEERQATLRRLNIKLANMQAFEHMKTTYSINYNLFNSTLYKTAGSKNLFKSFRSFRSYK